MSRRKIQFLKSRGHVVTGRLSNGQNFNRQYGAGGDIKNIKPIGIFKTGVRKGTLHKGTLPLSDRKSALWNKWDDENPTRLKA